MLFMALSWIALLSAATARTAVAGDTLRIFGLLWVVEIDRDVIADVSSRNGVEIVAADGSRFESFAYGSSVAQILVPSRRYERVASRIRGWTQAAADQVPRERSPEYQPRRRLRRLVRVGVPLAVAVFQGLGALIWLATPSLYPLFTF